MFTVYCQHDDRQRVLDGVLLAGGRPAAPRTYAGLYPVKQVYTGLLYKVYCKYVVSSDQI
jgi:hypothetical protein